MTVTKTIYRPAQRLKGVLLNITLDDTYPAAGIPLSAADFGLTELYGVNPHLLDAGAGGILAAHWDHVNQTLVFVYTTGGSNASPVAPAYPLTASGASTASAVDATRPTLTPGTGRKLAVNSTLLTSAVVCQVMGYGV